MIQTITLENYIYEVDGKTITLKRELVDRYSKTICPISEELLKSTINIFNYKNDRDDKELSTIIEADMEKELEEFGEGISIEEKDGLYVVTDNETGVSTQGKDAIEALTNLFEEIKKKGITTSRRSG